MVVLLEKSMAIPSLPGGVSSTRETHLDFPKRTPRLSISSPQMCRLEQMHRSSSARASMASRRWRVIALLGGSELGKQAGWLVVFFFLFLLLFVSFFLFSGGYPILGLCFPPCFCSLFFLRRIFSILGLVFFGKPNKENHRRLCRLRDFGANLIA